MINKLHNLYLSLKTDTSPSPVTMIKAYGMEYQNYFDFTLPVTEMWRSG